MLNFESGMVARMLNNGANGFPPFNATPLLVQHHQPLGSSMVPL
jgi:hypothetical protein